jgi:membrane fusion protein (multidrug efflux system)
MNKHRVAWVALGVLLVVAVAAYYLVNSRAPGPAVAGVKGEAQAANVVDAKGDASKAGAKGGPGGPGGATPVEVVTVKPVTVQEDLSAVGSLRSNESVVLRPEVSGRIANIGFRDGQAVKKGQVLVGLDATLNEAEVAQYQAEYDLALSNLKRSEDLAQQKPRRASSWRRPACRR